MTARAATILLLWALPGLMGLSAGCSKDEPPRSARVEINGRQWLVDIASTPVQHYRGLSGRPQIASGTGMLFIFSDAEVREFCMRGCLVPLDIAFLDENLRVVKTHTMSVEPDLAGTETYSSEKPAQYALEVPAGELSAAGVRVGDKATLLGDMPDAAKDQPAP
ncbi:MAG: DUF192 domain-containing protein [Phycisphaerae bacterium]